MVISLDNGERPIGGEYSVSVLTKEGNPKLFRAYQRWLRKKGYLRK